MASDGSHCGSGLPWYVFYEIRRPFRLMAQSSQIVCQVQVLQKGVTLSVRTGRRRASRCFLRVRRIVFALRTKGGEKFAVRVALSGSRHTHRILHSLSCSVNEVSGLTSNRTEFETLKTSHANLRPLFSRRFQLFDRLASMPKVAVAAEIVTLPGFARVRIAHIR